MFTTHQTLAMNSSILIDFSDSNLDNWDDDQEDDRTVPCPHCRQPVFEDSPRCSACGNYLSDSDFRKRPSKWMTIIVVILIAMWLLQYVF